MGNIVIKAEHLSKYYKLGVINNGTLFKDIQTWLALKRGKVDPHSRIGENKYDPTKEGFWALSNLDFEIKQGDRVGIIGKNGAGKSTLLKILSRITAPTEGLIKIKGRVASLLEVGTGFHGELTGRENIYLNGAILGMKRHEVSRKLDEIIAFSEIKQHIDTPVKRYSSGMYVRLAFAVAAHLDSEILIADEVLAVGDVAFQKKALGKMNDLSTGQGRTVLFVSHQMNAVKNLCNKGIVLEKGQIICDGEIDICIQKYLGEEKHTVSYSSEWINNEEIISPYFTPKKIFLVDSQKNQVNLLNKNTKDLYSVVLEFDIKEKKSSLNIGFSIINRNNQIVFTTWLRDHIETENVIVGQNIFYVQIPTDILNLGRYGLVLSAGLHHEAHITSPNFNAPILFFTVTGTLGIAFGDDNRESIITPIIKWEKSI